MISPIGIIKFNHHLCICLYIQIPHRAHAHCLSSLNHFLLKTLPPIHLPIPYNSFMKVQTIDHPIAKKAPRKNTQMILVLLSLGLTLFTIIPLYSPYTPTSPEWKIFLPSLSSSAFSYYSSSLASSSSSSLTNISDLINVRSDKMCDIFTGEWVPNPNAPYYTNTTCPAIHDHQNCMKHGRPDTGFLKWKWKPNDCELPLFDPYQFLQLLRGKSLAFVGDSVGRNQMQSLICLLSRVEYPIDISPTSDDMSRDSRRWFYADYNLTIANFWAPFLVRSKEVDPNGPTNTGLFNLYLDEFDEHWTTQITNFDYVIISAGYWFFRSTMFYVDSHLIGCSYCLDQNITDLTFHYSYRRAFRTAFRAINSLKDFKGMTFLRTFAPSHFENGEWDKGANCGRTRPFRSNETTLEGINLEVYMTQVEEFQAAVKEGWKRGLKFRLLNTTQATLLRPDGHPSRYWPSPHANLGVQYDCLHWCLPGPIDAWNDFLLQMLKVESGESSNDKFYK